MSTMIVDDFLKPLLALFAKPRGDIPTIAEALVDDCPAVTQYQLRAAVKALRQTWKYTTFPSHAACVSAIRSAPTAEFVPSAARPTEGRRPSGPAPILAQAEAYVDAYEAAGAAEKAAMDRRHPGRYEGALAVIRAFAAAEAERVA